MKKFRHRDVKWHPQVTELVSDRNLIPVQVVGSRVHTHNPYRLLSLHKGFQMPSCSVNCVYTSGNIIFYDIS